MQLRHAVLAALVAGFVLTGCQARQQTAVETVELKQAFLQVHPNAQVGTVAAILPDRGLLAIEDLPVDQFEVGETLVFMGADHEIIAAGHIVRKTASALHVQYSINQRNTHPQVGDLAVKPTM